VESVVEELETVVVVDELELVDEDEDWEELEVVVEEDDDDSLVVVLLETVEVTVVV
jgi:hypothetical protein